MLRSGYSSLSSHAMIINDGLVYSWGLNRYGRLGYDSSYNTMHAYPNRIENLKNVLSVSTGGEHSMALTDNGQLFSWGRNSSGQLGKYSPVGFDPHTCVYGKLSYDHNPARITKNVSDVYFTLIACGGDHSMALSADGIVYSWGSNSWCQLGYETKAKYSIFPQQIAKLANVISIACGNNHSMAISDDRVFSWGFNQYGQLGNRNSPHNVKTPQKIEDLTNIISIACGSDHSMALNQDGEVFSWGNNHYGQLGNGKLIDSSIPKKIKTLTNIISIACGGYHSMALTDDDQVYIWGSNHSHQIGNLKFTDILTPNKLENFENIKSIGCGGCSSMIITYGDRIHMWGQDAISNPVRGKNLYWHTPEIRSIMWAFQRIIWIGKLIVTEIPN